MATRPSLIGQTYQLPQAPQQQVAPVREQPFNDGINALEGIQNVNGQTSEYFRKVADLKSFMQQAQENLGIDVRVPDASRPESIAMNEIFRTALADIMEQGNQLKTGQAERTMLIQRGDRFVTDPTTQAVSTMTPGVDFFPTAAAANTTEINNLTQQASYTQEEQAQKQAEYDRAVAYWDEQTRLNPRTKAYNEYQKSILTKPAKATKMFAPPRDTAYDRRFGRAKQNAEIMLKKLVNLKNGLVDFEPSTKIAPSGDLYDINRDYNNFKFGKDGKTISYVRRDPGKNGKTEVVFTDGTVGDWSGIDVMQIAQGLAAGQNLGYDADALQQFVLDKGAEGELGKLNESMFLPTAEEQKAIKAGQTGKRVAKKALIDPIMKALTEKATNQEQPWLWGTKTEEIDLGGGLVVELGRTTKKDEFTIENIEALIPPSRFADKSGKINKAKALDFYAKFTKKPKATILKELLNNLPIDDFETIYNALGLELPAGMAQNEPVGTEVVAPKQGKTTATTTEIDPDI